ncbi:MAG: O-antigen ligase [Saprospiraceae bacterium]|jgi:O-antigen ligase
MTLRKIHIFCLAVLCMLIPIYQIGFLSLAIVTLFILTLIQLNKNRKVEWWNIIMSGAGIFLFFLISMLWTEDASVGWKSIETKLSLILIPLILGLSPPINKRQFLFISWAIVSSVFISSLMLLFLAYLRYLNSADMGEFMYVKLSAHFHPSYIGMYYTAGMCFIKFYLEKETKSKRLKFFLRFVTVLLVIMVALLSSKAAILSCFALLILALVRNLTKNKNGRSTPFVAAVTVLLIFSVLFNPISKSRINSAITKSVVSTSDLENDKILATKRSSTQARVLIWGLALEMILNSPSGEGVGDSKACLMSMYERDEQYYMLSKRFNVHNQFLETAISSGLISLIFMITMFVFLSIKALRNRDILMLSVMLIITLNLLTESMFERQSGAVFISLFLGLLIFRDQGEQKSISS